MKYDVGSDIHVDINSSQPLAFEDLKQDGSDVLVLAGDISNDARYTAYIIEEAAKVYDDVVFVDGNHEHYSSYDLGMTVEDGMKFLSDLSDENPNIHFLDGKRTFQKEGVLFVGANGWYDFKLAPKQYTRDKIIHCWNTEMNDSKYIQFNMQPDDLARLQADLIRQQVGRAQNDASVEKIVVITHTLSNPKGIKYTGNPTWDMLNGAYGNSCMHDVFQEDTNGKILHAICGHTHYMYDFEDYHGIRWVINPRGYHGSDRDVSRWFLVQLDTDIK
jgi:predicted phosphodiesterase